MSILKVLRVPLSFSLFNFQGPTHFFGKFFVGSYRTSLNSAWIIISHSFSFVNTFFKVFKKFFEISFIAFKSFFCAFKLFCCLCFPQATLLLYHNHTESQYLFKFLLTNQFVFSTYILYKMLHLSIIFYKYDIFYLYQDNLSTKTIILILLTSL